VHASGADDEDSLGAQVHRGRDRRRLAHRAVAAVLAAAVDVERDRREHERDRRRREQVRHPDLGAHREPLRARPRHDVLERVVEGDVQARAVARGGDREAVQVAVAHYLVQPVGVDHLLEERLERLVVEKRPWPRPPPARDHPADRHHRQPARAGADHADRIGAVHLLGAEVLPDLDDPGDRAIEVVGLAGERSGVDRARRRAGNDRKGIAGEHPLVTGIAPDLDDRLEHAHLIPGPRSAAREHEAGERNRVDHR
jgi:hypothetical protein